MGPRVREHACRGLLWTEEPNSSTEIHYRCAAAERQRNKERQSPQQNPSVEVKHDSRPPEESIVTTLEFYTGLCFLLRAAVYAPVIL